MLYRYTAIDRAGVTQKGERESLDEKTLSRTLRGEGLLLTSTTAANSPLAFFSRLRRRRSRRGRNGSRRSCGRSVKAFWRAFLSRKAWSRTAKSSEIFLFTWWRPARHRGNWR